MKAVLAIDPGLTKPGAAFLADGKIIGASRVKVDKGWARLEILERCDHVAEALVAWLLRFWRYPTGQTTLVVEWPQWYGDNKQGIDANDLAGLCGIAGAAVGRLRGLVCVETVRSPKPREVWGNLPKATKGDPWKSPRGEYLARRLSPAERAAVEDKHDALDAAGLALWGAGLWKPRKLYPGAV